MSVAGSSDEDIAGAKRSAFCPGLEALAHTLAYDAACLGDGRPPTARLRKVAQPTLVATGGGDPFFELAADAIAADIPNVERLTIEGQGHVAEPSAVGRGSNASSGAEGDWRRDRVISWVGRRS